MKIAPKELLSGGKTFLLRSPESSEAAMFLELRRVTSGETDFMARYAEEVRGNAESIAAMIETTNASPDEFLIGAYDGDQIIGCVGIAKPGSHIKYRHKASLGISILQKYCNGGLGTEMIHTAVEAAAAAGYEQLGLGVYARNERARHVYEKLGFVPWGREPHAVKLKDGTYEDEIFMTLVLTH